MNAGGLLLLDTSVVVHLCRGDEVGSRIDTSYGLRTRPERPLISVVTVGETLGFGKQRRWGEEKMAILRDVLTEFVVVDINHRDILERYAEIRALDRGSGWNLSQNDTWIAATASVTRALLLTTDRDFSRVDAAILSCSYIESQTTKVQ
ncbi:MAG TPA: type II toxin-antitoxin system VapC family toxin [Polyangia bacterium]|jgi:predicted nucleic acid-binding protein|nr:type II toxin-antitoxin system VapC family toxin [Polyangia bacterium]